MYVILNSAKSKNIFLTSGFMTKDVINYISLIAKKTPFQIMHEIIRNLNSF